MKIDIISMDEIVKVNKLKEVTNPIMLNPDRSFTEDGILSSEIFGRPGSNERKLKFAYIDLHGPFLHPLVYKTLIRLDRKFEGLVSGNEIFTIENGNLKRATYC